MNLKGNITPMKLLFNKNICTSRKFLINIDGVACDHVTPVCDWVNETFGLKSKPELVRTLDHNFGPITFEKAMETCSRDDNFIFSLKPYNGFHDFVKTLSDISTVQFVTSRKQADNPTKLWVEKLFGNFEVIFTQNKAEPDCHYIIDDHPATILNCAAQKKISFLMERPWNNDTKTLNRIENTKFAYLAKSYKDVISFLWSTNLFVSC